MITCSKCKKQTKHKEPTGNLRIVENLEPKGKRITSSSKVCVGCSGEKHKVGVRRNA